MVAVNQVLHGDCLEVLKTLPDNSIDSIVTDPPYGLSFMGKKWDYDVPIVEIWQECLRVLKPGGHLLAFAGTRTHHRMAVNVEDAGFEIRDTIAWVYGSGFPKSLDVSKAIDKMHGTERKVVGVVYNFSGEKRHCMAGDFSGDKKITAPATPEAQEWEGWGTALKPSFEPITLARKPIEGTVAQNVLEYGTGGLNIDDCRVETDENTGRTRGASVNCYGQYNQITTEGNPRGRWPANFIHDGSDEVLELFPESKQNGYRTNPSTNKTTWFGKKDGSYIEGERGFNDSGSAARFFYCAKASKRDRDEGLDGFEERKTAAMQGNMIDQQRLGGDGKPIKTPLRSNHHPTVKPTNLMRYLCRLITPPGGVVLDPFCGSGSTGKAAVLEGFRFLGIDREAEYVELARARINFAISQRQPTLEERVQWLETQVQAQSAKIKKLEQRQQLSLFG